jgi:predicted O-methyltransferase YrrM
MECSLKLNEKGELYGDGTLCPNSASLYGRDVSQSAAWQETNDFLIRKFKLSERRLRSPMPIERHDFDRNDLAAMFGELGFTKGAEIGVAEGDYSEILCQKIPNLELLCVDPWGVYPDNPRGHAPDRQIRAKAHVTDRLKNYKATLWQGYSMDAAREVPFGSLDFVYIDGNHSFDYALPDIVEWSKRVRSGGIVSGDDYFQMRWGGVVDAVNAYTHHHRIHPWFTCAAWRSVDWFWVRP